MAEEGNYKRRPAMDVRILILGSVMMALIRASLADNIKVEYFNTTTLKCDNSKLNITTNPGNAANIQAKYWILPSGEKIDNTSISKIQRGKLAWIISDWFDFSLTITDVNDEDFGMYYCVIVRNNYQVDVIPKGLNIDGPDYSKLIKRYRHNAMVGGIAAGSLFVIICGACLIHHFRYSSKRTDRKEGIELDGGCYDNEAVNASDGLKPYVKAEVETSEKL
ncbi:uncharacterized protein LOC132553110 [Ylistrum balloti]|uniref:uncharacterized protein LOC132553110 n=1 Tax=Ylistrum balloti TaxID=509963 RepID=UPI002905CADB|nr:uncharacterized protein LOC132553110 [Ylistrum balloti]